MKYYKVWETNCFWIILLPKIFKSKLFRYDCKRCQLNKNIFSIINIFFHSSKYSTRCSSFRSIVFLSLFLMMTRFWQTSLIKSSGPLIPIAKLYWKRKKCNERITDFKCFLSFLVSCFSLTTNYFSKLFFVNTK
jgi:hypothetical protein